MGASASMRTVPTANSASRDLADRGTGEVATADVIRARTLALLGGAERQPEVILALV